MLDHVRGQRLFLRASAIVVLGLVAPQAQAANFAPQRSVAHIRPGGSGRFVIAVDHLNACTIRMPGFPELSLDVRRLDQVMVRADTWPVSTRSRTYRITMVCERLAPRSLVLKIAGTGRRLRGRNGRALLRHLWLLGTHVRSSTTRAQARVIARLAWARSGAGALARFHNGQCTEWAARKRPDVVNRVFVASIVAGLRNLRTPPQLGNADTWSGAARYVGMKVRSRPKRGALVVWQGGVQGAARSTGHIGYVEQVSRDGSRFSTSEMNLRLPYRVDHRILSGRPVRGRQFIWP